MQADIRRANVLPELWDLNKYPIIHTPCKLSGVRSKRANDGEWTEAELDAFMSYFLKRKYKLYPVHKDGLGRYCKYNNYFLVAYANHSF